MTDQDFIPRIPRRRQRLASHTRACLLWGLAFFAVAQAAMLIATQSYWPHLRDPEFGYKLSLLRTRRAEEPERPLLVLLGSSRTGQGLRPGVLTDLRTNDGRSPLVFNFSQVGSGALAELVTLRRLLDAGIRPDWLAIEILPALLGRTIDACGDAGGGVSRVSWNDLQLLCRYVPDPNTLRHRWLKVQLWPWHAHRFSFMNHYLSNCVPWRLRLDHWKSLDRWGWSDIGLDSQPLVLVPEMLELARMTYQHDLCTLRITSMQDRALRDLLALCRQQGIPTVLYLMPEGSIFRGWYPPSTLARLDEYLARLSRDYGVPIVNARTWMPDKYFGDSHHLYRRGAALFTQRFGTEVLARLVQGKAVSIPSLLTPVESPYPQEQHEPEPLVQGKARPASPMLSINGGTAPAAPPEK
ncbi:MAG TPA: hypothetical protein VMG10_36915 [Gemmataceae bacterium]|nr:hypothetical protein [Gemmataceae bacterium]